MTMDRLAAILCCLPRRDALTRTMLSAALLTYGIVEDKAWARWFGIGGLVVTGYGVVNCYRSLAPGDDATARPDRRLPAPANGSGRRPLRIVPDDLETPVDQEPA